MEFKSLLRILKEQYLYLITSLIAALAFLYFAKTNAVTVTSFSTLWAEGKKILESLSTNTARFLSIALFQTAKIFNSFLIWTYLSIIAIVSVLLAKKKLSLPAVAKIFILAALLSFLLIICSNWSAEMGNPLRYYTYSYVLFALGLLSIVEKLNQSFPKISLLAIAVSVFTLNASIQFNKDYDPSAENRITRAEAELLIDQVKQELPKEKSISVIGSYWNSYLLAGLAEKWIAIPRFGEYIRDYRSLEYLQKNQYFILIVNEWLNGFPKELTEHNLRLKRVKVYPHVEEIQYALYLNVNWQKNKAH